MCVLFCACIFLCVCVSMFLMRHGGCFGPMVLLGFACFVVRRPSHHCVLCAGDAAGGSQGNADILSQTATNTVEESNECVICLTSAPEVTIIPCGHHCMCAECGACVFSPSLCRLGPRVPCCVNVLSLCLTGVCATCPLRMDHQFSLISSGVCSRELPVREMSHLSWTHPASAAHPFHGRYSWGLGCAVSSHKLPAIVIPYPPLSSVCCLPSVLVAVSVCISPCSTPPPVHIIEVPSLPHPFLLSQHTIML